MVSKTETSLIRAIVDVLGFLLLSLGLILRSILTLFLPSSYQPVKDCKSDVVLITGGGSGLGRLLALQFAKLGSTIIIWDINEEGLKETVKMIEAVGGKAYAYRCNIADREDVYRTAKVVTNEIGHVTILINNAGVVSGSYLLQTPDHLIQRTFDVNIISHFWTVKAFLPNMIENNHGHIVTIASMAGHVGTSKLVDYCASKYAAVGFDESLRLELETQGIRGVKTTVICPYFIQATGMFDDVFSRFMPTLKSSDVADRTMLAIRREELLVMMPPLFRYTIWMKWVVPWGIMSMILRNLVPDASPHSTQPNENTSSNGTTHEPKSTENKITVTQRSIAA